MKENKKRNSIVRGIGILITAFLFIALIYSLVAMMLSQIVPSIVNIASNFDTYISNFTKWISKIMDDNPELGSQITLLIDKYSVELENWLNNTVLTKTSQVLMTVSLSVINILKGLWDFIIGSSDVIALPAELFTQSLPDNTLFQQVSLFVIQVRMRSGILLDVL